MWDEIKGFEIVHLTVNGHTQKYLYINLNDPEAFFARFTKWYQRFGKFVTRGNVAISDNLVSMKLDELGALLQTYCHYYTKR